MGGALLTFQRKGETGYWIRRKGVEKFADTGAERGFAACMASGGLAVEAPKPVRVVLTPAVVGGMRKMGHPLYAVDPPRGWAEEVTLSPDHWMPDVGVWGYSDGVHHWTDTARRVDLRMRHLLYLSTGRRVFGVDEDYLTREEWWPEVLSRLAGFLLSDVPVWGLLR